MERGKLSHELKKVNLSAIARKVSDACSSEMPHHSLETDIEERIYIYGDEERLEQVIRNLLNNARKYSPKGETIYVDLRQQKGRVLFRVRDRGRGIDRKDVKKIFDRFYRGGVGARVSGMGLGLYIVKKIMDVHGGEIRVQTVPEKGSLFTLEFPVYPSEAGSEEV
jgi:signal transduction histidine kinase